MSHTLPSSRIVVVLAGGKATRFGGQDKGEIIINEERLIDIIHSRLKLQASKIIISGTHDYGLGFDVIPDADDAPGGPVGGLYSIWKILENRDVEGFFTVPIDDPNLPIDLTTSLYSKNNSSIATNDNGRHPTYGWWRLPDLSKVWGALEVSQSASLNQLADLVSAKHVSWNGNDIFANINREADLRKYVKGA